MKKLLLTLLIILNLTSLLASESKICQRCHPLIYKEYYNSIHRKSSLKSDKIYKALFEKEKQVIDKNECKVCHSPSAKTQKATEEEPISCIYCHTITNIQEHDKQNKNVLSGKKRDFYSAEATKKEQGKVKYKTTSSFFGLIKSSKNSPYHQIEYNNENYYNGNVCMGCHSHASNVHGFDVIMLDAYIDKKDKESCISCHMPKVTGSKTTLRDSKTHAYHGIAGLHNLSKNLGKYIDINVTKNIKGFTVNIVNHANHALFGQAYREGILKVKIIRDGKYIALEPYIFKRTFGRDGKRSMPFEATEVLKDRLIYAKKSIDYDAKLQKNDRLIITLGFQLISKETAKELQLDKNKELTKIKVLKTESFTF